MDQAVALARFVAETEFHNLPQAALQAGKRSLLDCLGTALGGAHSPAAEIAAALVADAGGKPQATLIARGKLAPLRDAALVNATAAHALDYDDTLSPPAAIVGFALAEHAQVSGRDLLTAYILGFEISHRVAQAIGGWENARRWHVMGVAGVFGAAAVAARLLRLNSDQSAHALGLAATQAAGLVAMHGFLAKPFHSGKAAVNGLLAAQLARLGCTSGPALAGASSFFHAMGSDPNPDITKELGRSYAILENRLKPFPSGRWSHAAIEVALKARAAHDLQPAEISSVRVEVNPHAEYLMATSEPASGAQSMFSIPHGVAAALATGKAGPAQFSDDAARDPAIVQLRRTVAVIPDPARKLGQAVIDVETKERGHFTAEVLVQKGLAENSMNDDDVREKFLSLGEPILGLTRAQQVADHVCELESLADAGDLARQCA